MKTNGIVIIILIAVAIVIFLLLSVKQEVNKEDIDRVERRVEKVENKVDRNFEELLLIEMKVDDVKDNTDTIKAGVRAIGKKVTELDVSID